MLKLQVVVEVGHSADDLAVQRSFDFDRGSLFAVIEIIVRDRARFAHDHRIALQFGGRRRQSRRVQVAARKARHTGQHVDARYVHLAVAGHDAAVQRNLRHHRLFDEQVSARFELLRGTIFPYLTKIVPAHEIRDDPEIPVAEFLPFRPPIQHHRQQHVFQIGTVTGHEFGRYVFFPRVDAVSEVRERQSHRRRFVGKRGGEKGSEFLCKSLRVAPVRQFDEPFGYFGHQQTRVARRRSAPVGAGLESGVKRRVRNLGDRPRAVGSRPPDPTVANRRQQAPRPVVFQLPVDRRHRFDQDRLSRQQRQVDGGSAVDGRIFKKKAFRLPLRMFVEHVGVGHSGRIASFVVQPQVQSARFRCVDEPIEYFQLFVAFEVFVRVDVGRHAAVPVGDDPLDHRVLLPVVARHTVSVDVHPVFERGFQEIGLQFLFVLCAGDRASQQQRYGEFESDHRFSVVCYVTRLLSARPVRRRL